ncbi:hypothetical protein BC834DRAFT_833552 [Gloeopeniophorella convolvens]|nr:hypothetical protein BC834DRAFT_833552 [Gloeopeniophorella convolvens]
MASFITLKSGEQVKINDHVYCSPSWSIRDGTPYSVARIMEFLPAENTNPSKDAAPLYTRVRLAWYYRPSDVSDRPVADSRLLLAAIYSEICDVAQLRAKCFVVHRDKITDLAGWKKRPDRFYFNRLFDPYIKKEFEVIQSNDVRNLPEHIRETLTTRYEYVVAEKEIVPDLTDTMRNCDTCEKWCPPQETVRCDRCKSFFHMGCVQPPLASKPTRGYGWTCGPCSRAHERAVQGHDVRHVPPPPPKPKSHAPPARGRGRPRKDRERAEKEESVPVRHFKMWPFRYFGLHTVAVDTLDPDDLIFPRTTTRVGPKYQASVPGRETPRDPDTLERGGDATVEVLSSVHVMSPEKGALPQRVQRLTSKQALRTNVDWLSEAIRRFSEAHPDFSTVSMSNVFRFEKWKTSETRYADREWDADEKAAFEDAVLAHGAELRTVRDEVGTRTIYEVVRYYAHWKNMKLGEEHRRRLTRRPSLPPAPTDDSDSEGSVVRTPGPRTCGACRTRESRLWWRAPKGLPSGVLCDACGVSWRKYADLNHLRPVREEAAAKTQARTEKREGTPLGSTGAKRAKTAGSVPSTPPPPGASANGGAPQHRCLACHKYGAGRVLKCKDCQTRVHAGACGAPDALANPSSAAAADSWTCDLCQNAKTAEASLNSDCVLCARRRHATPPPADSFLRVCKPTEGQGWVHLACAVFVPEVSFADARRLRAVEGISTVPTHRWATKCVLCQQHGGAVVRCADCPAEFHVSCAWARGYKFGFEIQPIKAAKREPGAGVSFNGATGTMHPVVRCKEHEGSRRALLDLCETNEQGETALQVYCATYKQAPVAQTHALLRKARRLDHILDDSAPAANGAPASANGTSASGSGAGSSSSGATSAAEPQCAHCHTFFSPFFHPLPRAGAFACHRCHFEGRTQMPLTNGHGHGHGHGHLALSS